MRKLSLALILSASALAACTMTPTQKTTALTLACQLDTVGQPIVAASVATLGPAEAAGAAVETATVHPQVQAKLCPPGATPVLVPAASVPVAPAVVPAPVAPVPVASAK